MSHIKGLKDIKELDLTPNPSYKDPIKNPSVGDNYVDKLVSPWICPITGLEMNGRFRFVFDWSNGKVLSERAYKMVKNDEAAKIAEENIIILNPADEQDQDLMKTKMEARKARAKAEKKAKKRTGKEEEAIPSTSGVKNKKAKTEEVKPKKEENDKKKQKSSVQNDPSKSEVYKSLFFVLSK